MRLLMLAIFFIVSAVGCKDSFTPEVDPHNKNLLVVEGYINIGGSTTITLSRSADLQDLKTRIPEVNAEVTVEGMDGTSVRGTSLLNGQVSLSTENLSLDSKYKLRINTSNGSVYQTDYLESTATPEIDSLTYAVDGEGFRIYTSTHDSNQTKFYLWEYLETWEIRSPLQSSWEYKQGRIIERDPTVNIERCWADNASHIISLGSTERLSENKLSMVSVAFVHGSSIKLSALYSILVKQYGLTRDAYQFMETMKKNTEEIGTIFDPQPSELKGNIICITNPKERVMGWISAGTVSEKRIFINSRERLRSWWHYREDCEILEIGDDSLIRYLDLYLINWREEYVDNPPPPPPHKPGDVLYRVAPAGCIDCRLKGSNIKPSYWPN